MLASNFPTTIDNIDTAKEPFWFMFVCNSGASVPLARDWFMGWTNCECYYPVAKKYVYPKRARCDAPQIVEKPALGAYLFARFYSEIDWKTIREQNSHIRQWVNILCPDKEMREPAIILNDRIMVLRRLEAKGEFDDATPDQKDCALSKLLKGHPVHIPYGQFFGVRGATLDSIYRKIVKIKITVLGKDVLVTFPFVDIFPDYER